MLSMQNKADKLFWSENLSQISSMILTSTFWVRILSLDSTKEQVKPPSYDSINQILTLVRDVQLDGSPEAVTIALETTLDRILVVKFEIYLIIDNRVKGSVELISNNVPDIPFIHLAEHLLDDPLRGVMITNHDHKVIFVNEKLCREHGVSQVNMIGNYISEAQLFHSSVRHINAFQTMIEKESRWRGAMMTKSKGDTPKLETLQVKKVVISNDQYFYVYSFWGLSSKIKKQKKLKRNKASHSLLDNILDEAGFRMSASELSNQGGKYVVVSFRPRFYCELAEESRQKVRHALQACHPNDQFADVGRDTYLVLLPIRSEDSQDLSTVNVCIDQFFTKLNQQVDTHVTNDIGDGQIGIALYGFNECDMEEVVSRSMQAMSFHESKHSKVNFYDKALVEAALRKRKLEQLLLKAIENKQIGVHFQPIVDTKTQQIVKLEALCRFNLDEIKFSVQEMIHLAEELDVVARIDMLVAERALEQFIELDKMTEQVLSLSLNCSIIDSDKDSRHLREMLDFVNASPVDNEQVTIEIIETSYFDNTINNTNLLKDIRATGVRIAVDDFGTGQSSFSYFSDFDFDVLKIDRKFITDIHQIKQKYFAVNMLRQLSHDLHIKVVAEGVETKEEFDCLKAIGVDYIQGYFFYRPMPVNQLKKVLDSLKADKP